MAYTFKYGDRPLDGITIQRAVGRGGFGEVYYALTDSGKQVAVKYLRENPEVELRGIAQVMNLKSPHLITIYDVRRNAEGEPFVIMEYVSGPSLRDLLNAHPDGLGPQKAAYFLQGIAAGLSYLHERGIVHRDLKPGNIFYDDGYVKIGDYGLSKHISVSRHSGNTVSVGTVHYMAPEIGSGSYTKAIDIYALGVILYEMLTGRLPFTGSSFGEILMRHLNDRPDLAGIEEPFRSVIAKALAKNPDERFADVNEMVDAVVRVQSVSESIASFDHTALSRVPRSEDDDPDRTRTSPVHRDVPTLDVRAVQPPPVPPQARPGQPHPPAADRLPQGLRANWAHAVILLMLTVAAGVALGIAFGGTLAGDVAVITAMGLIGATVGTLVAHFALLPRVLVTGGLVPRLVYAATACALMSPALAGAFDTSPVLAATLLTLPILLAVLDWNRRIERGRRGNVRTSDAVGAGVVGLIAGGMLEGEPTFAALLAAAFSLLAQSAATMWPLPQRVEPARRRGPRRRRGPTGTAVGEAFERADAAFERAQRRIDTAFGRDRHADADAAAPSDADAATEPPQPFERTRSLPARVGRALLALVATMLLLGGLTTALVYHSRGWAHVQADSTSVMVGNGQIAVARAGRVQQVEEIPRAAVIAPIAVALVLLMLLRRRDGAAHFLRGCLAAGLALAAALLALGPASDSMAEFYQGHWDSLDAAAGRQVARVGLLAVASLILLFYPRRRGPRPIVV